MVYILHDMVLTSFSGSYHRVPPQSEITKGLICCFRVTDKRSS